MKKQILVVEDQEDVRVMMRLVIENFGYSVIEAAGPFEAVQKAEEFLPSLILMDIGLPLLDGLSAAKLIGEQQCCSSIPIVVLTAYHDVDAAAANAGCVDVLYKPVEFEALRKMIDSHIGH